MCENFQVFIDFKEVYINGISDDFESKEVELSLDFLGTKIGSMQDDNIILIDGAQLIKQNFILKSEVCLENEEYFMFQTFGCPVKIQLHSKKLEGRLKRKSENFQILFANGLINLLENLKDLRQKCKHVQCISLNVINSEKTEVILTYKIKFENAPKLDSTLSIRIDNVHNFPLSQDEIYEAAFQFPFDKKFRAVFMQKVTSASKIGDNSYLMDELLKERNFEIKDSSSIINLGYENFQTDFGTIMLHDMIRNGQKIVIELKLNDKLYMTCLDLTIFNHPEVTDVNYLVPIYEWNNKLIFTQSLQEACFVVNETASIKKRSSKKSMKTLDSIVAEDVLTSLIIDDKYVALKINVKLSKALNQEQRLESLMDELNNKFPYKLEIKQEDFVMQQSQKDLHCIIKQMSNVLEKFIDCHSNVSEEELLVDLKKFADSNEFCLKTDFKKVLTTIIGNTFNQEEKTRTNHEFKLLMMKAFKSLNKQINSILIDRYQKKLTDLKVLLDEKICKWQIEEYIRHGNPKKAEELIERELTESFDEAKMREKALYLLKLKKYDELEIMLRKLFRVSRYCSFSLYILSYLCVHKNNFDMAIFLVTILTKLKPQSMEYWILLSSFYGKIGNISGVRFCSIKIQGTEFIPNYKLNDSVIHPEIIFMDPITNILWHQLKFSVLEYYAITKIYAENGYQSLEWSIERIYIEIIELIESKKYQVALDILKRISIDDENEIIVRILKGNVLYEIKEDWKAISEYEIAFNLCLKFELSFPLTPAIRTGSWYLKEMEMFHKAKRYFTYCCKNFGTFDSFMGLGRTDLKLMIYHHAEKSLIEANVINKHSSDNWTLLALTSCKLKKIDTALDCYLTAKNLNANESPEMIEVEKYLDI
ncbi:unnamed protein product [Chironomus riparius]|uniref:Uncharacterized protein n=1 Tax=Chironomus riparius TaxID=315576 RepID=A0A9N9RLU9_9DIPT|nr:unnamed protein product [Chironomus riparius]